MIHRLARFKHDSRLESIWLTIYADLITNIMLVFLALYGLTVMGDDALSRAIQSMRLGDLTRVVKEKNIEFADLGPVLREKLKGSTDIAVREEIGAVRIEFGEKVLFNSGMALPKKSSSEPIRVVANLLKAMPHTVVVEGHTDALPVAPGGSYKDNNELSLARSMSVVNMLIQDGIPAAQIAAAAYGSFRPRASNDNAEGRGLNRRVEIVLFKDFPYGSRAE